MSTGIFSPADKGNNKHPGKRQKRRISSEWKIKKSSTGKG